MRDLKFRVWDDERGNYLDKRKTIVVFKPNRDPEIIYDGEHLSTPAELEIEQFTGIKDIQGSDIYDGDIIIEAYKAPYNGELKFRGESFEVKSGNYVMGKWIAKDVLENSFGVNGYLFGSEIFILGNIHENTDLLGAK